MSDSIIKIPKWQWPIALKETARLNEFLDKFIGENEFISKKQRLFFIDCLYKSISLNKNEKQGVIRNYENLSSWQYEELCKVFENEIKKFHCLEKVHPQNIRTLVYKAMLEWSLILNEDYGDIVFFEQFFGKSKALEFNFRALRPFVELLDEYKRYMTLYNVTRRLIKEPIESADVFDVYNIHLYSVALTKLYNKRYEYSLENIRDLIWELELSETMKSTLMFFYLSYMAKNAGFPILGDVEIGKYARKAGRNNALYSYATYFFFSEADVYRFVKYGLKLWQKRYDVKFSIDAVEVLFRTHSSPDKLHFLNNVCEIIVILLLSGNEALTDYAKKLALVTYEFFIERRPFESIEALNNVFMLEFILNRTDISSQDQVQLFIAKSKEPDVLFFSSIDDCFISTNQFINTAKRVINGLDNYGEITTFFSYITIYLMSKSSSNETNVFILDCLEKEALKTEGVEFNKEFEVFINVFSKEKTGPFYKLDLESD